MMLQGHLNYLNANRDRATPTFSYIKGKIFSFSEVSNTIESYDMSWHKKLIAYGFINSVGSIQKLTSGNNKKNVKLYKVGLEFQQWGEMNGL